LPKWPQQTLPRGVKASPCIGKAAQSHSCRLLPFSVEIHYGDYCMGQALKVSPYMQLFAWAGLYEGTGQGAHLMSQRAIFDHLQYSALEPSQIFMVCSWKFAYQA
jgi:hypothetical protein